MTRVPALDGLRAIAIIAVLLIHADVLTPWYSKVFPGGFLGVHLFFVLSGFFITRVLLEDQHLGRFYTRRAFRILPPLLAAIVLAAILSPWAGAPRILPALFFYANFIPSQDGDTLLHTWSLSVEEQFYIVWPLAFLVAGRWRLAVLGAVVVASGLYRFASDESFYYMHRSSFARADALAMGCMAALIVARWPAQVRALGRGWVAVCCLLILGASFQFVPATVATNRYALTPLALVCAVLILAVLHLPAGRIRRALSSQVMTHVGLRSYGLYLYHLPVFYLFAAIFEPYMQLQHYHAWTAARVVVSVAVTVLLAELSWRSIEARAMKARRLEPVPA